MRKYEFDIMRRAVENANANSDIWWAWYADAWNLPKEERAKLRSRTFPGIARAMAEQWAGTQDKNKLTLSTMYGSMKK